MEYIAYLHKDRKSDFGVSFPDFPGCITAGKTLEESRRNAEDALALHITGMIEDGEAIPEPSTLDDIADDPAIKDAVAILVNVDSEKRVRVNITARESQIDRIDRLAEEAGMTRSAYCRSTQKVFWRVPAARVGLATSCPGVWGIRRLWAMRCMSSPALAEAAVEWVAPQSEVTKPVNPNCCRRTVDSRYGFWQAAVPLM